MKVTTGKPKINISLSNDEASILYEILCSIDSYTVQNKGTLFADKLGELLSENGVCEVPSGGFLFDGILTGVEQ